MPGLSKSTEKFPATEDTMASVAAVSHRGGWATRFGSTQRFSQVPP